MGGKNASATGPTELGVLSLIHLAHSPAADLFQYLIVADQPSHPRRRWNRLRPMARPGSNRLDETSLSCSWDAMNDSNSPRMRGSCPHTWSRYAARFPGDPVPERRKTFP